MSDYSGRQVGNYHLTRLLGKGGFASVYLGEHRYLGSQAAVKVMPTALTKENRELFLQEARVLAQLNYPGIVRILEFGIDEASESTYLAMQYAPRGTTRTLYPRGTRPPLKVIASYIAQVAASLQYAHEHKIVHRDIKPENLLIDREGQVLLSDFGIAMIANSVREERAQDTIAGTIFYMAPEQLQGKPGAASDQYALGIVAYEWLCGQTPFIGSISEVLAQHLLTPPYPLRYYQPDFPDELEQVVLRALAKEPEKRFPSVLAFAQAFAQASAAVSAPNIVHGGDRRMHERASRDYGTLFGASRTLQASASEHLAVALQATERRQQQVQISVPLEKSAPPTTPRLSRRALLAGGVGVAGVAGLGALGSSWFWRKAPPVVMGDEIAVYRRAHQKVGYVAWLPDSKRVLTFLDDTDAYLWDAQTGANEQWLYPGARLYGTTLLKNICLAPDGRQYALATDRGLLLGHLNADTYETLATRNYLLNMYWSPGGDFLVLVTSNELEIWDVRQKKQVYTNNTVKFPQSQLASMLQWAPGGRAIASLTQSSDARGETFRELVSLWSTQAGAYGKVQALFTRADVDAQALAWSPDGTLLAVSYQNADVQVWDVARQRVVFACAPALKGPQVLAWSPDGRYLLGARDYENKDTNLYVWQMQGGAQRGKVVKVYRGHTQPICSASWSPDSRMLLSGSGLDEGFSTTKGDATARVWRAPS
ncbi:hypothetical protein KSD_44420 [Ktedonobacter sp. SOSP1-85]|uniref:WD40 repeat domain-containing serine/threonine protein kinase n=1 Tax=Ktedonobacter sp. SOSP1-85 TaxID=2778367 RepID=UPI001915BD14|nr:serine/threonine-protein kinase [Ktedonobacter sp. SOSP1-85]GHO76671.1 hypothetical protein KSD_44420 [Ktedonobacter sp. SOSP1-85]